MSTIEIYQEGGRFWKNKEGELHRKNGPAVEYSNGGKHWCLNGRLHRMDGPAIEDRNGKKFWFIHGKTYSELEYKEIVKRYEFLL